MDVSYLDRVVGAAIFDLNGLPKQYYISTENADITWIQTIFQALGLQALLNSAFQLKAFRHAVIHGSRFYAVIIRQPTGYVALLINQIDTLSEDLLQWAIRFDPAVLADDPRFHAS